MKKSKYPGLRSHTWRTASGEMKTAYYLDNRSRKWREDGPQAIPLGCDHKEALRKWFELTQHRSLDAGTLKEAFDDWEREVWEHIAQPRTKRDYGLCLRQLRPVFENARWADVTLPVLKSYLTKRTAKTRANREMAVLQIVWNWARQQTKGYTTLHWPAAGMEKSRWKNHEPPRRFTVTGAMFDAVYACADQVLKDGMDIASATAMRVTDTCNVLMPAGEELRFQANKTGKEKLFLWRESEALRPIVERRKAIKSTHLMLLSTPTGQRVTPRMLGERFTKARAAAVADPKNRAIKAELQKLILRDMRRYAANLAPTLEDAAALLDHDDKRLTSKHYRTRVNPTKAVR